MNDCKITPEVSVDKSAIIPEHEMLNKSLKMFSYKDDKMGKKNSRQSQATAASTTGKSSKHRLQGHIQHSQPSPIKGRYGSRSNQNRRAGATSPKTQSTRMSFSSLANNF